MGNWMLRGSLVMAAALLLGASACGSDDPVIEDDDDGSTSSSSATSGAGGAGGNGATSSSSSTTTGGQGGMGQGGMGQGGASMICNPDPNDTACATCAKNNCCMDLENCEADMQCGCVADCVLMGGDPTNCAIGCGAIPPSAATTAVGMCVNNNCSMDCQM